MRAGVPSTRLTVVLIHTINLFFKPDPELVLGTKDASGVRLHYTTSLRQEDMRGARDDMRIKSDQLFRMLIVLPLHPHSLNIVSHRSPALAPRSAVVRRR